MASSALLALSLLAPRTHAETLTITSSPAGASLEIDGVFAGTTPYKLEYPGGYFHKTHSVFSARLQHSMVLRISKVGYATQQITLTSGPFEWVAVNGRHHGSYFLLRSDHFDIQLDLPADAIAGPMETSGKSGPMPFAAASSGDAGSPSSNGGTVMMASDPTGAEIYVDGKFVGQTPSIISLASGQHRVEMKSQGRQNWECELEVLKDSQITLHPVLKVQR